MKEAVEFIKQGVINRKFDEELSNVHICGGNMISFNGIVTMCYPIDVITTKDISVESSKLLRAVQACNYQPQIKITEHNIILKSKTFRAQLPYTTEFIEPSQLEGEKHKVPENFIPALTSLWPMVSDDASRSWSQSILIKKKQAHVTNNTIIARAKISLVDCTLPLPCVSALIRVKQNPETMIVTEAGVQFNYPHGGWIQTRLIAEQWPKFGKLFKKGGKPGLIPDCFRNAVETLRHFSEEDILVIKDHKATAGDASVKDVHVDDCALSTEHTIRMLSSFDRCDFSKRLMSLKGKDITGVMIQRMNPNE